jgi:DNA-binding NtrC family response regulator
MDEKIQSGTILNILSLEDSTQDFEIITEQLINAGYNLNILRVEKKMDFATSLRNNKYDIILADFDLPGFDAFGALRLCNQICPDVPFICVSGTIGEETAIELIKQGAD